jgi:hypothetical protein
VNLVKNDLAGGAGRLDSLDRTHGRVPQVVAVFLANGAEGGEGGKGGD